MSSSNLECLPPVKTRIIFLLKAKDSNNREKNIVFDFVRLINWNHNKQRECLRPKEKKFIDPRTTLKEDFVSA